MSKTESNLFASAVDDDGRLLVRHQVPPTSVVDLIGIDGDATIFCRELKQAQFRTVRVFGDELGIERDQARLENMIAQVIERGLLCNQGRRHGRSALGMRDWENGGL